MPKTIHVDACEPLPRSSRLPMICYHYLDHGQHRFAVAVAEHYDDPPGCGYLETVDEVRTYAMAERRAFLDKRRGKVDT